MARYWLGPWEWDTSKEGGECWRAPAQVAACLDLRSVAACAATVTPSGFGLFVTPNAMDLGGSYENLGTDPLAAWGASARNRWASALALPQAIQANNLRAAIWETLTIQADPIGDDRAPPLVPRAGNRTYELWLAGQLVESKRFRLSDAEATPVMDLLKRIYRQTRLDSLDGKHRNQRGQIAPEHYKKVLGYWVRKYGLHYRAFQPSDVPDEQPLKPETTITDDFNRADAASLGTASGGFTYTEFNTTNWRIVSNQANTTDTGSSQFARADSDLSADDNYGQIDVTTASGSNEFAGALCRKDGSATQSFYMAVKSGANQLLRKRVAGTNTTLRTDATTFSIPDTLRVSATGSTIEHFFNGASKGTSTDTAVAAGLRCGLAAFGNTETFDNFEAADFGGGGLSIPIAAYHYNHHLKA